MSIQPYRIIEKYYVKDSPLYRVLVVHSEQVRNKALEAVMRHPELPIDAEFVGEACLLHDIGIFLCHAPGIYCFGKHEYIEHGYLGSDLLKEEGLPKHALVAERHTGTGFTKEEIVQKKLPLPHRDMLPVSLEEQLICYADKFYSKSKLNIQLTVEEIRQNLSYYGNEKVEKFDSWHKLFG
jgi:uncharacterized protein